VSERPKPKSRSQYRHFLAIPTRWADNDVYGHVNNVVYYAFFDTAVNRFLMDHAGLDPMHSPVIGLVVETRCNYFAPIAFPETVEVGIAVGQVGRSSIRYEIGVFAEESDETAAHGHFVHVYVEAATRRPTELPAQMRAAAERIAT
jgi:acyl-CoA thioester hydrolase